MKPRLVFMGTPEFAVPSLEALSATGAYEIALVITQPDRPAGRGRALRQSPIKQVAERLGLPVWTPENLRGEAAQARLRAVVPDVQVVVAYGEILRRAVLEIPQHGTLNVHASLLPKYRGPAPIAGALLAGERETGVSIMLLDPGMDTGPILSQRAVPILPEDTAGTLHDRLAWIGAQLLTATLPRWLAGEIAPQPQDQAAATVTRMLSKEDGRLDWTQPASVLANRVRAFNPWPGAFTLWNGKQLKILTAQAIQRPAILLPGTVAWIDEGVAVATGNGWLRLETVQLAGRRPQPIESFVHGYQEFVGSRLGEGEA
ncbi:MAG: methionyl-tRNA formyltransferase [Ardenticatenaceae bacterium]|nr:methionyl-tRNA formyltransferase [Ardenticatenaceae bacterium]HBY93398.1 methionyl-tRNA formyltransferase [Chloroflexota bacterium]